MVNTIGIFDQSCLTALQTSFNGRRFTERYEQLTDATGGVKANLCDDFSGILSTLTDTIIERTTRFYLNKTPNLETLQVLVNGVALPDNAFRYNEADNSISFKVDFLPADGDVIQVLFQPTEV